METLSCRFEVQGRSEKVFRIRFGITSPVTSPVSGATTRQVGHLQLHHQCLWQGCTVAKGDATAGRAGNAPTIARTWEDVELRIVEDGPSRIKTNTAIARQRDSSAQCAECPRKQHNLADILLLLGCPLITSFW